MKRNSPAVFAASLAITAVAGYFLFLTGIWYLLVLAGLIPAIAFRSSVALTASSTFLGGIVSTGIVVILLPLVQIEAVFSEVSIIAGISSSLLLVLTFLVSALLSLSGGLIGSLAGVVSGSRI